MNNQEILAGLGEIKNGCYFHLTKKKALGDGVVKVSELRMRKGVSYANLKINEGKQVEHLPWGHWVEGLENLVIEHKGNYYLRVTSCTPENPESGADVISTKYLLNNAEISKEQVVALLGEKKLSGSASAVYNIKFDNILALN